MVIAARRRSPFARMTVWILATVLGCSLASGRVPEASEPPAVPGTYDEIRQPPLRLGRLWTARRQPARVLHIAGEWERTTHNAELTARSDDPQLTALAGASVQSLLFDVIYGLGADVSLRTRLGWMRQSPGEAVFLRPDGGGGGSPIDGASLGFADMEAAVTYAPGFGDRVFTRFEAGVALATGSDLLWVPEGGAPVATFTSHTSQTFLSAAGRTRLTGTRAAVDIDLHIAGSYHYRQGPPAGQAFAPYPVRVPLLGLDTGGQAFDRFDFQAAFSMTRGSTSIFAVLDWPLLRGAEAYLLTREAPRALTPGVQLALGRHLALTASVDVYFHTDDYTTEFDALAAYPEWGLRIRIGTDWVPVDGDRDGDLIGDRSDRCPDVPEDRDGYADTDGCPDPDNDLDGIDDGLDACPDAAEDADGFQDEDGCPDPDNDQDGVEDRFDGCPDDAEDVDGFRDEDGCPDPDNDRDGVPDGEDACPDLAPDRGGDADGDGCPDVPDRTDAAPSTPDPQDEKEK